MRLHVLLALAVVLALGTGWLPAQGDKKLELSAQELAALKKQRDLANAYLRQLTEQAINALDEALKVGKVDKDKIGKERQARVLLQRQLAHYTGLKTSPEELTNFHQLLKEADRQGIKLNEQALQELVRATVQHRLDAKGLKQVEEAVRKENPGVTSDEVQRALTAEFRARIVRELNEKKRK